MILTMDIYLRSLDSSYFMKMNALEENKDSIEIVILGNSHATYGVDPDAFDDFAINLANANQSIFFDKRILLKHIDQLPNLKYVLISVDFHSLGFSNQGERNVWSYYATGVTHPKLRRPFLADISPFLFGYGPNFSFKILIKNLVREKVDNVFYFDLNGAEHGTPKTHKGYIAYKGQNTSEWNKESFQARASHFQKKTSATEKRLVEDDLKDLISILQEKGIQPILFSCPTYSEYNKLFDQKRILEYQNKVQEIAESNAIPFWDYAFENNFSKEDFFNCDHLNEKGAYKFARELNEKLKGLQF